MGRKDGGLVKTGYYTAEQKHGSRSLETLGSDRRRRRTLRRGSWVSRRPLLQVRDRSVSSAAGSGSTAVAVAEKLAASAL